jgi:CDP-glycerol glycerophosphotransferase (TagB/SpsB family)
MRAQAGVDPERPVVLFAPTWSGGDRSGLFNIRHLNPDGNMFAIPHDGDVRFANELANDGSRIHVLNAGESISYYYAVADILVSTSPPPRWNSHRLASRLVCPR